MSSRVPALDGLRAVSIALVVISHANAAAGFPQRLAFLPHSLGDMGVTVFFVISGFIITHLLLRDGVNFPHFYTRRAFRILPPCLALLAVVALLGWADARSIAASALFSRDYCLKGQGLDHLWSLAVEEQFYLLWPAIMFLGSRFAGRVSLLVILLSPLVRVGSHLVFPRSGEEFAFHMRADGLMTGCALAIFWSDPRFARFRQRLYSARVLSAALLLFFGVSPFLSARFLARYTYPLGFSLNHACIALLMCYAIERGVGWLNWKPVVHVGRISYSLYLWQTPILFSVWQMPVSLRILVLVMCAELSWKLVELPAFRARDRWLASRQLKAAAAVG